MSTFASETARTGLIAELRNLIAGFEASCSPLADKGSGPLVIASGARAMDAALPDGGLSSRALHEVRAASYGDMSASIGFAVAMAVRCAQVFPEAPVLWCESARTPFDMGGLYGPGLAAFGLDPARLILVTPASDTDLLWTMEEALRLGAFAVVIGEIDGRAKALTLTATRRLQLAAEEKARPALLLTGHASMGASAAATRWRVASAASSPVEGISGVVPFIGRARWQVQLEKCRGAQSGGAISKPEHAIDVEWHAGLQKFTDVSQAETRDLRLPPDLHLPDAMQAV